MVVVEATNDEGTTADSAWLHLRVCPVDTVPYQHTFGFDEDCWRIGDGWYVGDTLTVDGIPVPAAVSFSHNEFGDDPHVAGTIATPWLYLPDGSFELRFAAAEVPNIFFDDARMDRFSVIVRTHGTQLATDTLYDGMAVSETASSYRLSLADYADRTVQVVFCHHDSPVGFGLRLAAVEVQPVAPQRTRVGENVSLAASVVSSETLAYTWHIDGATPATGTGTGSPVDVSWLAPGVYTVRLTAVSPLYGAFSDSTAIIVIDCDGTATLPYSESFDLDMGCWTSHDLDGDGYGWEMTLGGGYVDLMFAPALAYGGSGNSVVSWSTRPVGDLLGYILSASGTPLLADNMIVSPLITLPADGS